MKVRVAHVSLQFKDTPAQHTSDIAKIFERAVDRRLSWITGTEAGPGANNTGRELIRIARANDYRIWVPSRQGKGMARHADCWIAVRKDLIRGKMKRGYKHVIPGSSKLSETMDVQGKRWGPKGLVHVTFDSTNPDLGRVSVGAAHYLTGATSPSSDFWEWNEKLARAIGAWARKKGRGSNLVFYGGDQNMQDHRNNQPQGDTFFGEPLTSTWDELEKWKNTGHGVIDVIASYNRDKRVKAVRTVALNDRKFHLHTDHFYVEAEFEIEPAKKPS